MRCFRLERSIMLRFFTLLTAMHRSSEASFQIFSKHVPTPDRRINSYQAMTNCFWHSFIEREDYSKSNTIAPLKYLIMIDLKRTKAQHVDYKVVLQRGCVFVVFKSIMFVCQIEQCRSDQHYVHEAQQGQNLVCSITFELPSKLHLI